MEFGMWNQRCTLSAYLSCPALPCPACVLLCLFGCMCVYVWCVRVLHRLVGGCCLCGIVPYQYYCSILVLQNNAVGLSKIGWSWSLQLKGRYIGGKAPNVQVCSNSNCDVAKESPPFSTNPRNENCIKLPCICIYIYIYLYPLSSFKF